MISIFNRQELRAAISLAEVERIRTLLERQNISYTVKTKSPMNADRGRGIPGIRMDAAYVYRVYVRKEEADKAEWALQQ